MALNNASKMKKEISEYIVAHVLDHSDILIRGSQKRQNYDNEMRQELWAKLASKLSDVFDAPMEPEKVKQHFHNRRKAVMGRVRDDLKRHGMDNASVDEKMDWIKNRRVVVNDNDLQIVEYFFNKEQDRDTTPAPPMVVSASEFDTSAMNFLNELVKTESNPSGEVSLLEDGTEEDLSTGTIVDSTEPMAINVFSNPQLFLPTSTKSPEQPSQVIVEVPNKSELKRLLSLLIDNDFATFAHVNEAPPKNFGVKGFSSTPQKKCGKRRLNGSSESGSNKKQQNGVTELQNYSGSLLNGHDSSDPIGLLSETADWNTTANLLFEMAKNQPEDEENDEEEDINVSNNALVDLMKSFGTQPEVKRKRTEDGIALRCELCKNVVRLNQSGSKWNLYEHVVLNHSTHRPYKCTKCSYSGVRKGRVRQHIMSAHESDDQPMNVATPDIRELWDGKMLQCFPNHKQFKGSSPTMTS